MTLEQLYKKGTEMLKEAGIENPSVDAFYLLEYAGGLNRTRYLMYKEQEVSGQNVRQYTDLLQKRMERIPCQYITGSADFAGLTFEVNPSVLIPRLDTEVLFEHTLKCLVFQARVLDLCTGSGCLGIALKRYRPDIRVVMSDISGPALKTAADNVQRNHLELAETSADDALEYGVRLIRSDLFEGMAADSADALKSPEKELTGRFDVIVSNPPYVTESEYGQLMPEVREHEPKLALTAGADGLACYRRIAKDAPGFLKEGGTMLLEIGSSQAQSVCSLFRENGFTGIRVEKDLAGLDRVVICRRP